MRDNSSLDERILKSALQEFGTKGYNLSSTNTIAADAQVSKGLIFKKYKSKAELFYTIYQNELNRFLDEYRHFQKRGSKDVFEQIVDIIIWKGTYTQKNPEAANVLLEGIANPPSLIRNRLQESLVVLREMSISSLFSQINRENLRDDISREMFEKTLNLAIAGLQATYVNKNVTYETLNSVKNESIEFLKIIIRGMEK
ncbi:TetR/AcrR family transcriptional regulator [Acholeplasma granularum]|uniref:TetR/AcrR family transcriptional regulator n=1 Tax=Acholeplasma granularum TaxID=264635 RepID=UPI00046FCBA9|nr:TetR/AcrR family transcriptional regulator [Acholeplasma granularum]